MALLFDEDYEILNDSGLKYTEIEDKRFLIIENYPLPQGLYVSGNTPQQTTEVLVVIPPNYNTSGIDMLWTYPHLSRADGKPIPASSIIGDGNSQFIESKEYCRWSRHWQPESWKPKIDNINKILSRIEWAFQNPDADQK